METISEKSNELYYFKCKVALYFYFKAIKRSYMKELMMLRLRLETEPELKGVSWDSIGSGCSASFPSGSPLGRIREAAINAEYKMKEVDRSIEFFKHHYGMEKRYQSIGEKDRGVIYEVYCQMHTPEEAARNLGLKNPKSIYRMIDKALIAMKEVY